MKLNSKKNIRISQNALHCLSRHPDMTMGRTSLAITVLAVAVMLSACGGGGGGNTTASSGTTSTATGTQTSAVLTPDCTGAGCGTVDSSTYSGSGLGVWKYDNTGSTSTSIDININGVNAGQSVTLLYSNGSSNALASVPTPTVADSATANPVPSRVDMAFAHDIVFRTHAKEDSAHAVLLKRNIEASNRILAMPKAKFNMDFLTLRSPKPQAAPAIGTAKTWIENSATPVVSYATSAVASCQLPSGRNVVFWLDPNADSSNPNTAAANAVAQTDITAMTNTVCGANGGFDRMKNLLGDVWGSNAAKYSDVIHDTNSGLQDINVAILAVPSDTGWAGYFYGGNNILKSSLANSNESLVFFINASQVHYDRNYALSTLLHEATHMTNFYQRLVTNGVAHDTWLEETSAMMTEDIVSPAVINGYNKIDAYRLPSYLYTGGGVSYINWPDLSSSNYAVGGSFGAYLNRRFGVGLYQQLVTSCPNETTEGTSYSCLDSLIKANGGAGFADEYTRFGASMFGAVSAANGAVAKYGFPAVTSNGYALQAIDVASKAALIPTTATTIGSTFPATTHTYLRETAKSSTYSRKGVSVPAQSTLIVVVQ